MLRHRQLAVALACTLSFAALAHGQTTGTSGGTATSGTTGTTSSGGATTGGNSVSSSGGSSATGVGSTSSSGTPFSGVPAAGFTGGNAASTATNTTSGAGSTTTVPSANNPWRTTYGNVYSLGQTLVGSKTSSANAKAGASAVGKGFGQPLYTTATTSVSTTNATTKIGYGYTNTNISRVPRYTTVLGDDLPPIAHVASDLQSSLQSTLARSSALKSHDIRVVVNGDTVTLVGAVSKQSERRLAENLVRLTPGVSSVANQIVIPGDPSP